MAVKEIVAGSGTRYGWVFALDTNTGLPLPSSSSAVPSVGVEISGIKSTEVTDPTPRRVQHKSKDRVYAQDTLPADSLESFRFTSSKVDLKLDAYLEGVLVRSYTNMNSKAANNADKGNERQVMALFYRQALDADPDSSTFGKLRLYNARIFGSARIVPITPAFGDAETDVTYEGTPTNFNYTPWNEAFTTTNWGTTDAGHLENVLAAHPRINTYLGNGTITAFQLSHAPVDSDHLLVWQDGTIVTPSAVNTSTANPAFTLSAAATNAKLLFALIQTNNP